MTLNKEERDAIDKKLENPKLIVKCPRCGAELEYREFPTAWQVICKTPGCIQCSLRGI